MRLALQCPDCERLTTFNGRGRCRCGSYLIHDFAGRSTLMPAGRVWCREGGHWKLLVPEGDTTNYMKMWSYKGVRAAYRRRHG